MKHVDQMNLLVPMVNVYKRDGCAIWMMIVVTSQMRKIAHQLRVLQQQNLGVQKIIVSRTDGVVMETMIAKMEKMRR